MRGIFAVITPDVDNSPIRFLSFAACKNGTTYEGIEEDRKNGLNVPSVQIRIPLCGDRSIIYTTVEDPWLQTEKGDLFITIQKSSSIIEIVHKEQCFELYNSNSNPVTWEQHEGISVPPGSFSLIQVIDEFGNQLDYLKLIKRRYNKTYFFSNSIHSIDPISSA